MKKLIKLFICLLLCAPLYGFENPLPVSQEDSSQKNPSVGRSGVVVSTLQAGSYTYIELDQGDKVVWIAGPATSLKKGDKIRTSTGSEMHDFFSKTLRRNFPVIFFVGRISTEETSDPPAKKKEDVAEEEKVTIKRAEKAPSPSEGEVASAVGVYTLADVFNQKVNLQDKEIKVRGKIVKSSGFILGKHWYHIQDGTDMGPHNADLVMTTDKEVESGDVIEAVGILKLNRDFGSGYKYPIILENAKVVIIKQNQESPPKP
ncbi:MAG: hypothetical protein IMF07_04425 [Proteobacteria bacterium]|nr:hypothetical protein [Pseudomonadota bacterium]